MTKMYGQLVRPEAVITFPHFAIIRDRLNRVSCDTHSGEEVSRSKKPQGNYFSGVSPQPDGSH